MKNQLKRREFLEVATTVAAVAFQSVGPGLAKVPPSSGFKKAVKFHMISEELSVLEKFKLIKTLGFDGIEILSPNDLDQKEVLEARDQSGLPIHGVIDSVHWRKPLSDPNPKVRAEGVEALKVAISDARAYGASTVLLVPAVVNKEVSYDQAYERSQHGIQKILPMAERYGIKIAIENVWNQFLLSPLEFASYIDSFQSPWIGAYFDVGNIVNYGWPEHWIRILDRRILKLDIKEYSREKRDDEGPRAGFQVKLGEGDCDWPAVRKALAEIGYQGWATAEVRGGGSERLRDIASRMDRILHM